MRAMPRVLSMSWPAVSVPPWFCLPFSARDVPLPPRFCYSDVNECSRAPGNCRFSSVRQELASSFAEAGRQNDLEEHDAWWITKRLKHVSTFIGGAAQFAWVPQFVPL
jgi:hypothetical protein